MKKILILMLVFSLLPLAMSAGDNYLIHASDGSSSINGTDICVDIFGSKSCLSDVVANASGDITEVNTNGPYLLGGATSGAANLLLNETFLNGTIDARAGAGNTSFNQTLTDSLYISQSEEPNLNVNSSDNWDSFNSANTTWFENLAGVLSLRLTELTSFINAWFAPENATIARIGDCPNGQFVVNTTTGGVECDAPAGSGDITSVEGDDIYIYNGSGSGDVVLVFNETKLNSSIDDRATGITEEFANNTYVNIDGDNMTGPLSLGDNNLTDILRSVYNLTGCSGDTTEGTVCWNPVDQTLDIVTGFGQVIQVGREVSDLGNNTEGTEINNGQVVYLSGVAGSRPAFKLAKADFHNTSGLVGVVTTDCAANAVCPITTFGSVRGINLSQFNSGDKLYISDTEAGNFTTTPPLFPGNPVWVATVIDSSANGSLFTFPKIDSSNGVTFNELGVVTDIIQTDYRLKSVETDPVIGDNAFCVSMNGSSGEDLCHLIIQKGGLEHANVIVRSLLVANEVVECLNNTNRTNPQCYADQGGFTWNIDFNTSSTGADLGVSDDLEVQGDVWMKSSTGQQKFLSRTLNILDKFFSNLLLNRLNSTVIGDQLSFIDEDGESLIVNINDIETILPNNNDTVTLLPGTNSTPNNNFIFYTDENNPTLTASTSEPTGDVADIGRIIFGANYSYAGIIDQQSEKNALQNILNRFFESGALYLSGFEPNATQENVTITGSGEMRIISNKHSHNKNLSSNDFFLVLNNGTYLQCVDLQCITEYGDGGTIGNIKEFNVVWSLVHNDADEIRLLATVQNQPPTEFISTATAESDTRYTVFFETTDSLDRYSLPILRTIVRRSSSTNTQQSLSNGLFFLDVRGTTKATGAGGASPSISQHNDLSNLEWSVAGHTIDTTIDLSSNSIIGGVDINSTQFYQDGNIVLDTTDEPNLNVNSSVFWAEFNSTNSTQFENENGQLHIITSWLTSFVNGVFNSKTTDNLTEGSTNLYDNSSWNQTLGDSLYADISIDGTVTSVTAGDGMDFSTITSSGAATLGTPGTLNGGTANSVSATSHLHAVTTDATGDCGVGEICGGGHEHPASEITTGTFGSGNYVMDTNLTVERIVFENSANHFMEDNSTCVKIFGSTSILEIC